MFKQLSISDWRQFSQIDITFHDQLTVLTGANGAGKTSLLQLLSQHFGWNLIYISTPFRSVGGVLKFFTDMWHVDDPPDVRAVGELTYSSGAVAKVTVPAKIRESYKLQIAGSETVPGVYITSHRPVYAYKKVESIPTQLNAHKQLLDAYLNDLRNMYQVGSKIIVSSPSFRIKESLIALATFGYGNQVITPNTDAVRTFEGFEDILRTVLPDSLGFTSIKITPPEVILETTSGHFSLDAVSGGVASLMDTAWQLYMCQIVNEGNRFVAVIDEPENHLHPELQQTLLPKLIKAFPKVQYIIATHNPFMITSTPDSHVYVLMYNDNRRVESRVLDFVNKAGSANEILRDVLGLPYTVPRWVQDKLDAISRKYENREIGDAELKDLRNDMVHLGLGHLIPEAITKVLEKQDDSPH